VISKQNTLLPLDFAASGHRPDRFQFPSAVGIIDIVQVDSGIDVAQDRFNTISYVQHTAGWLRPLTPRQNAMFTFEAET
jgi:hypothetical protein